MALQLITNKIGTCGDLLNNFIGTLFHRILSNLLKLLALKLKYSRCEYRLWLLRVRKYMY